VARHKAVVSEMTKWIRTRRLPVMISLGQGRAGHTACVPEMIKWIRTSRLSTKKALSLPGYEPETILSLAGHTTFVPEMIQ